MPIVTEVPQIKAIEEEEKKKHAKPDTGGYTFNNWKVSAQYSILCVRESILHTMVFI